MGRKITANLYMTLDGFGEFPEYPGSSDVPAEADAFWREFWLDRFDAVDTVVMGRRSFEGHRKVWTESARKPSDPAYLWEYSRWLDQVQKVLLSRTLKSVDWPKTRILDAPLEEVVAQLRREPGKDIIVEGGPAIVRDCLSKGLADDYRIAIQPVVYGRGPAYWQPLTEQRTLRLLSVKSLPHGELILHYEALR